ncbi:hypothetical protein NQ314_014949 [Rhamnusium bicolor]|uniref:Fatty acyl-CoA reductase n=1 Tax=Rhamnusium bicolor TaxID=1586634 RepID=A0AAV8X099_9CUCU|nr:hypothetical protein NQ314_014949 [Rhamnusium bicolor]
MCIPEIMEDATVKALNSMANLSPIQEFYSNTNILITGGTGFFGNVLMEKLLRSCPTISKIYILIRNKRGIESKARVLEILDDVLFTRLKEECPDFRSKVVGIHGDLTLPNLGLSVQNEKLLIDEVVFVFYYFF